MGNTGRGPESTRRSCGPCVVEAALPYCRTSQAVGSEGLQMEARAAAMSGWERSTDMAGSGEWAVGSGGDGKEEIIK